MERWEIEAALRKVPVLDREIQDLRATVNAANDRNHTLHTSLIEAQGRLKSLEIEMQEREDEIDGLNDAYEETEKRSIAAEKKVKEIHAPIYTWLSEVNWKVWGPIIGTLATAVGGAFTFLLRGG